MGEETEAQRDGRTAGQVLMRIGVCQAGDLSMLWSSVGARNWDALNGQRGRKKEEIERLGGKTVSSPPTPWTCRACLSHHSSVRNVVVHKVSPATAGSASRD